MSAVGPRPALWSQFDLVAERDLYGANNVRPRLTAWAQINGRNELSIKSKAMRDGWFCFFFSYWTAGYAMFLSYVIYTFPSIRRQHFASIPFVVNSGVDANSELTLLPTPVNARRLSVRLKRLSYRLRCANVEESFLGTIQ